MDDPYDLGRFIDAQADIYRIALSEIRSGRKQSHWMWFIFPQLVGLGTSATASRYAIRSGEEAESYLAHPILWARYVECVNALQDLSTNSAKEVFGPVDAQKLQSSLTLFSEVAKMPLIAAALDRWFGGQGDPSTVRILASFSKFPSVQIR